MQSQVKFEMKAIVFNEKYIKQKVDGYICMCVFIQCMYDIACSVKERKSYRFETTSDF